MSFANRFNKGVNFNIDTKDFKYVKLADLYKENGSDVITTINGMFVVKGKIATAPVFIDKQGKRLINIPAHITSTVLAALADPEAVQAIKDGKVGFTIRTYESHGKVCYTVNFVDL